MTREMDFCPVVPTAHYKEGKQRHVRWTDRQADRHTDRENPSIHAAFVRVSLNWLTDVNQKSLLQHTPICLWWNICDVFSEIEADLLVGAELFLSPSRVPPKNKRERASFSLERHAKWKHHMNKKLLCNGSEDDRAHAGIKVPERNVIIRCRFVSRYWSRVWLTCCCWWY